MNSNIIASVEDNADLHWQKYDELVKAQQEKLKEMMKE